MTELGRKNKKGEIRWTAHGILEKVLDVFDRDVFESIIEKVIVGGYDKDGNPDPYKLTFVLKGNQSGVIPDAKNHYKEMQKGKVS